MWSPLLKRISWERTSHHTKWTCCNYLFSLIKNRTNFHGVQCGHSTWWKRLLECSKRTPWQKKNSLMKKIQRFCTHFTIHKFQDWQPRRIIYTTAMLILYHIMSRMFFLVLNYDIETITCMYMLRLMDNDRQDNYKNMKLLLWWWICLILKNKGVYLDSPSLNCYFLISPMVHATDPWQSAQWAPVQPVNSPRGPPLCFHVRCDLKEASKSIKQQLTSPVWFTSD
jgi:hypothetical protein